MNPAALFCALMVGHALADYPLQGDFLAKAKNHKAPIPGVPWLQALGAHALIHGGMVAGVLCLFGLSAIWWLGVAEAVLHASIDHDKCDERIDFNQDQLLHTVCKAMWVLACVILR